MLFKAGFAGCDAPIMFPSVTDSLKPNVPLSYHQRKNIFVGDEAITNQLQYAQNHYCLEHPIQGSLITDWDKMEKVFTNNLYL